MTAHSEVLRQWRVILAAGAVWVGSVFLAAEAVDPPTTQIEASAGPVEPIEVQWRRYLDRGKFETFTKLANTLRNGTTPSSAVEACSFLIDDPKRLERMTRWCELLDGPKRAEALRMLFAELMLSESDPDLLYQWCVAGIETSIERCVNAPLNHASPLSWGLSRCTMACILGYQATHQERFLDLVSDTFERIVPLRDSELGLIDQSRGRAVHSWGSSRYAGKDLYGTEITTAGRITFPIALWIQIVKSDPELSTRFGEKAERFLALIRETMDEFETDYQTITGTTQGYYLHLVNNWAEPVNHMAWAGNGLLTLHQITGREKYRTMAEGIGAYLRTSMWVDEYGCLVWDYMPQPDNRHSKTPEWVWKAAVTIELPLFFAKHDVVFTKADLQQIGKTFLVNIHQGPNRWNAWLKHEFSDLADKRDSGGLLSPNHFIVLGEFDPSIRDLIEELVATHPEAGGWLRGTYAIMGYAYRLDHPAGNPARAAESLTFPPTAAPFRVPRKSNPARAEQLDED